MVDGCRGTTKDGNACAARPMPGRDVCPWHAPVLAARRQEWSAKGGQQRSNQSRARKSFADGALAPIEVQGLIGTTLRAVLVGKVTPGQGQAVAALARAAMTVREASEVEERLAALEQRAGISDGRTG
jgi:hypothetical protein